MKCGCIEDVVAEFFPGVGFGENRMAQGSGAIATFFGIANFEDQLHETRIQERMCGNRLGDRPHLF